MKKIGFILLLLALFLVPGLVVAEGIEVPFYGGIILDVTETASMETKIEVKGYNAEIPGGEAQPAFIQEKVLPFGAVLTAGKAGLYMSTNNRLHRVPKGGVPHSGNT